MSKDYSSLDDITLFQQYSRITHKLKDVTLKKLQMVINQYNQARLQLSQILIRLDKRGHVNKSTSQVVSVPIKVKDENGDKDK